MQLSKAGGINIIEGSSGESETPETTWLIAEHRSPITDSATHQRPSFWLALRGDDKQSQFNIECHFQSRP
jgi:hypothetical protein